MAIQEATAGRLTHPLRRWWRSSWLCWQQYRWTMESAGPDPVGFWRTFERQLRQRRKRLLGRQTAPPPAAPQSGPTHGRAQEAPRPGGAAPDFALYVNSHGNYFFVELAQLLQAGLQGAGWSCQLRSERDGPAAPARKHLVLAPHEFFFLAEGWRCFDRSYQGRLFLLNTEQTHTKWFRLASRPFFLARHIFDMSQESVRLLRSRGYSASHLRFGFVPGFPLYDGTGPLPLTAETEALPAEVRAWRDADLPLAERPLAVCFFGEATTRRARILAGLAPWLQGVESYLRLKPQGGEPWRAEAVAEDWHTRLSAGLARRSRVLLNLHRNDEPYFEWHRIVLLGLWQRTLVVTEPVADCAPFVPGRDFVQAPASEFARVLEHHLRDPQGIAEAERIRQQGFRTLCETCDFPRHLREVWAPFVETGGSLP
jgi:hypothetical protein